MATEEVTSAAMRKLLNDPADVVKESLAGLAAAHARILRYDAEAQILTRADAPVSGKVALISGGGSGHEPLHGGFVGKGMLDAACPGEVFTSPVPEQMLAATKAVDGGAGVIHIVKNYTGDVMNFKLAAEDAADDGISVESVLVDDDVAVQDSLYTARSEEHTSELQSQSNLVCRLLLEKKNLPPLAPQRAPLAFYKPQDKPLTVRLWGFDERVELHGPDGNPASAQVESHQSPSPMQPYD